MKLNLYKYLVMLFRLINTSVTFQTFINNILREYINKFIIIYLNDILIYLKIKKEYV